MNANELLNLGNELTRLSSDYLDKKCVDDNDVQILYSTKMSKETTQ